MRLGMKLSHFARCAQKHTDQCGAFANGRFAVLLAAALISLEGCMGYIPGEKSDWDARVAEMCKKEGGTKVFQTIELSPKEYDSLLNRRGQVDLPHASSANLDQKFVYTSDTEYLARGAVEVRKYVTRVLRRSDGSILAERISFARVGGDPPLGLGHQTHFLCPPNVDNFFAKPFKRNEGDPR